MNIEKYWSTVNIVTCAAFDKRDSQFKESEIFEAN